MIKAVVAKIASGVMGRLAQLATLLVAVPAMMASPGAMAADALKPISLSIVNDTGGDLACQALMARWYTFELGRHVSGTGFSVPMVVDAKTGTLFIVNKHKTPMPVRLLYCGIAGEAWVTRYGFEVQDILAKSKVHTALTATCTKSGSEVACRFG